MKSDNNHIVPGTIMASDEPAQSGGMLSATDVTYLLFRQKWKIIICFVLGLLGAVGAYFMFRPGFQSDSKIMIRYVVESRSPSGAEGNMQIRTPDTRGETVVNSEVELLQSLDLATEVVNKVGATNILKELGGGDSVPTAARVVRKGLEVQANPRSNVIGLTFQHPDARIARLVLATLIEQYRLKHRKVHQSEEVLTELREDVTKISREITETETQLRKLKNDLKIVSLQDESKTYGDLVARLRMEMMETESGLAASRATLARFTNVIQSAAAAAATNQAAVAAATPADSSPVAATNSPVAAPIPPDVIAAYQDLLGRLSVLRTRQQVALLSYTSNSIFVRGFREQIVSTTAERDRLTGMYPGLTNTVAVAQPGAERIVERALDRPNPAMSQPLIAMTDVTSELAKYSALEAKYKVLTDQYDRARREYSDITAKESEISRLERQLQISEKQYAYYSTSLQEAKLNDAIDSNRMNNISVIQEASPAYSSATKTLKIVAGFLFGSLGLGLVLALVSEFYVDQSVRRPRQVSEALNIPLFLSVPRIDVPSPTKLLGDGSTGSGGSGGGSDGSGSGGGDDETDLRRYAEALRDRLIMHFQISELHHKPKLIGVTSCGRGAGVTTLATTLAASLSETGEGSVLYVDVNQHSRPSAHPFRLGKPVVGISNALAAESKETALVSDNLYMVSLQEPNSRKIGVLPKKLASLVPEIKASSYDYIIFDLPPVSQTSSTARVAGLLDMTVVVLESEKTHQSLAKQAVELLAESNTKMVGVLNKHKRYVPQKLESDI